MKEATKRATSEALAHMLAVTAMLVIASILFYWNDVVIARANDEAIHSPQAARWIASLRSQ